MPIDILMPALSPTMEEGTLAKWHVKKGDNVKSGDVIAEIETDKATMEVEAVDEGVVEDLLVAEGTEGVKVNTPIARLSGEGGAAAPAPAAKTAPKPAATPPPPAPRPTTPRSPHRAPRLRPAPRATRRPLQPWAPRTPRPPRRRASPANSPTNQPWPARARAPATGASA